MAALLQYLFLAAFCWMMCEGIMLNRMLVVDFSKLSKKWWLFLLLGWGECIELHGTPGVCVVLGVNSLKELQNL